MAKNLFTGAVDGNFATNGNWSAGTRPAVTEDIYVNRTDTDITGVDTDAGEIAYGSFHIGGEYSGNFATSGQPQILGSVALVEVDAPLAESIHLGVGTGKTVTLAMVKRNSNTSIATVIYGPGTITTLACSSGITVIESTAVITKLEVSGNAVVIIKSGATVGAIDQSGGTITNAAAVTNDVNLSRGNFQHAGTTTFNIGGTVRVMGGNFTWEANGGTFAAVLLSAGLLNLNAGRGSPDRVITTFRQTGGKLDKSGLGANVTFTASTYVAGDLAA